MKNLIFFILIIYTVFFLVALFSPNQRSESNLDEEEINKICINNQCINVEIADTDNERALGLMYREELEGGMLFVFDEPGIHKFWMKNTKIPLDIMWIDNNSKIIYIYNAQPCVIENCPSFGPDIKAMYVLEVNTGYVKSNNLSIGDSVKIQKSL